MKLFGKGMMITFTEVGTDLDDELNEWYNREHLDERINLPGFRRARRYQAVDAGIKYMSTYECAQSSDIGSPTYLDVLAAPSEWSERIMPQFLKWHRMVCRVVADSSCGMGSYLSLIRFYPDPEHVSDVKAWITTGVLDELSRRPRLTGACAIAVDLEMDQRLTRAFGQEPDPNQIPEWGVLVEGTDPDSISTAVRDVLTSPLTGFCAPNTLPVFETWKFLYGNQRLSNAENA
ncbi:MAG: hypothetical protein OSB67_04875 [Alphaproteobacteria bacterium]|nr:hypothetical protein [Alphaproteobacteria bacterium]